MVSIGKSYRIGYRPGNPANQLWISSFRAVQVVPQADAGIWTFLSYSLISEETVLDQNTTVPGYAVARPMVSAGLVMWPRVDCTFITLEDLSWAWRSRENVGFM